MATSESVVTATPGRLLDHGCCVQNAVAGYHRAAAVHGDSAPDISFSGRVMSLRGRGKTHRI